MWGRFTPTIVCPSPGMLFIWVQASAPPAPGLLMTIISFLYLSENAWACNLAAMSDSPPAANGMMYWTGLSGYAAASDANANATTPAMLRPAAAAFMRGLLAGVHLRSLRF